MTEATDEGWRVRGALLSLGAVLRFVQRDAARMGADAEASYDVACALAEIRDGYLLELASRVAPAQRLAESTGEGGFVTPAELRPALERLAGKEA